MKALSLTIQKAVANVKVFFSDKQRDGQTDKQTDGQADKPKAISPPRSIDAGA